MGRGVINQAEDTVDSHLIYHSFATCLLGCCTCVHSMKALLTVTYSQCDSHKRLEV